MRVKPHTCLCHDYETPVVKSTHMTEVTDIPHCLWTVLLFPASVERKRPLSKEAAPWVAFHLLILCLYVYVHMCTCMSVHVHVEARNLCWKSSSIDVYSTYYKTEFLIELGAHWQGQLSISCRDTPTSAPPPPFAGLQIYATKPSFLCTLEIRN